MNAEKPNLGREISQGSGGYELVLGPVLLSLLGLWIDSQLGTTPWLTVGFVIAGFAGAVCSIYFRYRRDIAQIEAETAAIRQATRGGDGQASEPR